MLTSPHHAHALAANSSWRKHRLSSRAFFRTRSLRRRRHRRTTTSGEPAIRVVKVRHEVFDRDAIPVFEWWPSSVCIHAPTGAAFGAQDFRWALDSPSRRSPTPHNSPSDDFAPGGLAEDFLRSGCSGRFRGKGFMARIILSIGVLIVSEATVYGQSARSASSLSTYRALIDQYCVLCHDEVVQSGGLTLTQLDLARIDQNAAEWEKVVRQLRAGMMPPAGMPRPDAAETHVFVSALGNGSRRSGGCQSKSRNKANPPAQSRGVRQLDPRSAGSRDRPCRTFAARRCDPRFRQHGGGLEHVRHSTGRICEDGFQDQSPGCR